jgi:hypothetical protein
MDELTGRGIQVLIPPDGAARRGVRPGWNSGRHAFMRHALACEIAGELYRRRQVMIEPVFANSDSPAPDPRGRQSRPEREGGEADGAPTRSQRRSRP